MKPDFGFPLLQSRNPNAPAAVKSEKSIQVHCISYSKHSNQNVKEK